MRKEIENLVSQLQKNNAPSSDEFESFLKNIDFPIDPDFLDFVREYNGGDGSIGKANYLGMWGIADLIALNPYYEGVDECNQLFFFGTDGSNFGYAFDKNTGGIVGIDFMEITTVEPKKLAVSFKEFLERISM